MVRTVQKVFPEDLALILMLFNFRPAMNWTEDKDIFSSYIVIVRVSVVLKRTVVGD